MRAGGKNRKKAEVGNESGSAGWHGERGASEWEWRRESEREEVRGREANNTADTRPLSPLHSQRTEAAAAAAIRWRRTVGPSVTDRLPPSGTIRPSWEPNCTPCPSQQYWTLNSCRSTTQHYCFSRSCTPIHLLSHPLSKRSAPHFSLPVGLESFCCFFPSSLPSELSGFTFILWRTMGPGWRGAGRTLLKRTEESWYLLVALLLLCGFWEAHTQTDDGKSVYFWETGTAKPLIRG